MSEPRDRVADLELAIRATVRAGRHVRAGFGDPGRVEHKTPDQPVSEADLAVDRELRETLTGERPSYGWLSEETEDDAERLERSCVWIVDPIDGTRSFLAGYPDCVISVGLAERGEAALGVLHNALTGELYWAVRGAGAYGVRIGVRDVDFEAEAEAEAEAQVRAQGAGGASGAGHRRVEGPALPTEETVENFLGGPWGRYTLAGAAHGGGPQRVASVLVSRSEMDSGALDGLPSEWRRIRRGSTAYKMSGVAAGVADAFVSLGGKSEWDVAAAALLVREAGGVVTNLHGEWPALNRSRPRIEGVVAARGAVRHEALLARVAELRARAQAPADE